MSENALSSTIRWLESEHTADRALLHRAAEMLRKLEWQDVFLDNGGYGDHWELQCPSCHAAQKDAHAPDCPIPALIRELESRLAL